MVVVKVKRLPGNEDIPLPKYQTKSAAAFDLHAAVKEKVVLQPGEIKLIPTGLKTEFARGFVAQITPRSGLALKHGISLVNTPGILDSDYRGEVGLIMINHGKAQFEINRGDRVAQMLILKVEQATIISEEKLSETARGAGGFGSTGK